MTIGDKVKTGAVSLAEGIYLLKVPRPFAPAGDVNRSTGPNPPELSPTQIQAKLDKDPVLWQAKIEGLRNVGLEVMEIVKRKDTKALFEASEDLDKACESCHLEYCVPWRQGRRRRRRQAEGQVRKGRDQKEEVSRSRLPSSSPIIRSRQTLMPPGASRLQRARDQNRVAEPARPHLHRRGA